ncbi:MAG: hypothetical protein GF364_06030 [Candidatus Lokiarchaeota archaeon]|nr:hypothetical protein [Candidatus Lokiarchaeota archaeon]
MTIQNEKKNSPNPLFPDDRLTPRDRVLNILDHKEADRVPLTELSMDSAVIAKYYGSKQLLAILNSKVLSLAKLIPFWRHLVGFGMKSKAIIVSQMKGVIDLYSKMGFDIVFTPLGLFPTKGHNREWRKKILPDPRHYVDEFGRMFQLIDTKYGIISYYKDGILKTPELYDKFGPIDPDHPARMAVANSVLKLTKNKEGREYIFPIPALFGVVESTWEGMGLTAFSKYVRKDKKFIKRVMKDRADFTITMAKKIAHLDYPVMLIYDDYGYKQGPFLSPKNFKELVIPQLQRIVDGVHKAGMKLMLHSCGNLNEILDDIISTGVDALHPIEPTAYMDIFKIKEKYGEKVTLMGNVSPQDLQDKPPDYIREYVRKLMSKLPKNGGYIFSSGHSINPAVELDNYLAMRDEFKKHCYYEK